MQLKVKFQWNIIDFIKCLAHEIVLNDKIIIIIIIIIINHHHHQSPIINENKNSKIQNRCIFVQKNKGHIFCLNM